MQRNLSRKLGWHKADNLNPDNIQNQSKSKGIAAQPFSSKEQRQFSQKKEKRRNGNEVSEIHDKRHQSLA